MTLIIIMSPKHVKAGGFIKAYGQIGDVENRSMGLRHSVFLYEFDGINVAG